MGGAKLDFSCPTPGAVHPPLAQLSLLCFVVSFFREAVSSPGAHEAHADAGVSLEVSLWVVCPRFYLWFKNSGVPEGL